MSRPVPRLPDPGQSERPQPRLPSPYRPDPRPHVGRTVLILVLLGVLLLATAWLASEITRPTYVVPPGVTQPTYNPTEVWGR